MSPIQSRRWSVDLAAAIALVALAALSALTLPAPAQAQASTADRRAVMQACRNDVRKLCAGLKPGGGRIAACLGENKASLSPGCSSQVDRMGGCPEELKRLCPDAGSATELAQCAKHKRDELSGACRSAVGS